LENDFVNANRNIGFASFILGFSVLLLALGVYLWFSPHAFVSAEEAACPSKYPECSGAPAPAMPGWDVPTNPQERAAYDYAHAIKLPECVNKPVIYDHRKPHAIPAQPPCSVPFDFRAARMVEHKSGKEVAEQYFQHLCRTEAGEFIFRQAKDVEGVYLMRPRHYQRDVSPDFDRYGTEDPTGIAGGDYADPDSAYADDGYTGLPTQFIQPMEGQYLYLEQPDWKMPGRIFRYVRKRNSEPPYGTQKGVQTSYQGNSLRLPFLVVRESAPASTRQARYAITWRGLRRPRDREFAIAGGELIVLDMQTTDVLAVRRVFVLSGKYFRHKKTGIWWANARNCPIGDVSNNSGYFAPNILLPLPHVNDNALLLQIK
jgi:hypothetical protein